MAPEEELGLLVASAWGMKHEAQWRVPAYARWCEEQDATPAYAHMADLLRLTGWLRGEDPAKPWLLETPQRSEEHTSELQSLMTISYAVFCMKKKTTNQNEAAYRAPEH